MSPHAARLFFGCSISFLLGGAAGVFGLRTLYGDVDDVDPVPVRTLECPPPPPCPACPPPVDCDEGIGDLPPTDSFPPETLAGVARDPGLEGTEPGLPGLPASVLPVARAAVRTEVMPCVDRLESPEPGIAVLRLTVTATGGAGGVAEAEVTQSTGGAAAVAECLAEAARRARFDWSGPDGQIELRLPLAVGDR